MIILRRPLDVELNARTHMAGRYRLVLREADGTVIRDFEFPNLITDLGLNQIADTAPFGFVHLGTSTTPPAVSDTSMPVFSASAINIGLSQIPASGQNMVSPYEVANVFTYRFGIGALNGSYTDIGVGPATGGGSLFSRALIVDSGGSPTSLVVNSSQQLDAFYTIYRYPPLVDTSDTVTIAAVSYTAAGRARNAGNPSSWQSRGLFTASGCTLTVRNSTALGLITGAGPTGASAETNTNTRVISSYVSGSYERDVSMIFSTAQGNLAGGVSGLMLNFGAGSDLAASLQHQITPAIPKDATKTMALNFRVSWGRRP